MKRHGFIALISIAMFLVTCTCSCSINGKIENNSSSIYKDTSETINSAEEDTKTEVAEKVTNCIESETSTSTTTQLVVTTQTTTLTTDTSTSTSTTTKAAETSTTLIMHTTSMLAETQNIVVQTETSKANTEEQITQISTVSAGIYELPQRIKDELTYQKNKYPGMKIGVGIYSLDGSIGYVYNKDAVISAGCTIKAPYAMYVLKECEKQGIDIWNETLTYQYGMKNDGSGEIKNAPYGTEYTISYLLKMLLGISDNTAYNILISKFPLSEYQTFINQYGGQKLNGYQYGAASVEQRKNEWVAIYKYINSNSLYSKTLRDYLTNTRYCYLTEWMSGSHNYLHKSGWNDSKTYTTAADCAIIDNNYLIIVITQDYTTGVAHTDVVKSIGVATEKYVNTLGGFIF